MKIKSLILRPLTYRGHARMHAHSPSCIGKMVMIAQSVFICLSGQISLPTLPFLSLSSHRPHFSPLLSLYIFFSFCTFVASFQLLSFHLSLLTSIFFLSPHVLSVLLSPWLPLSQLLGLSLLLFTV